MSDSEDSFIRCIDWLGSDRLQILLYALRSNDIPEPNHPDPMLWPLLAKSSYFVLTDEPWPFSIDLFEYEMPNLPENFQEILAKELSILIEKGTMMCWYMFEGSFMDIQRLFLPEQANAIYGIAWRNQSATLAITDEDRQSTHWYQLLAKAAMYLEQQYPTVRHLYATDGNPL